MELRILRCKRLGLSRCIPSKISQNKCMQVRRLDSCVAVGMAYGDTLAGSAQGIEKTMLTVNCQAEGSSLPMRHIGQELTDQRLVPMEPLQIFPRAPRQKPDASEWVLKLRKVGWIKVILVGTQGVDGMRERGDQSVGGGRRQWPGCRGRGWCGPAGMGIT